MTAELLGFSASNIPQVSVFVGGQCDSDLGYRITSQLSQSVAGVCPTVSVQTESALVPPFCSEEFSSVLPSFCRLVTFRQYTVPHGFLVNEYKLAMSRLSEAPLDGFTYKSGTALEEI